MTDDPYDIAFPSDPDAGHAFAKELVQRAVAHSDPAAAFAVARYNLRLNSDAHRAAAGAWFDKAIEWGGKDVIWRAVSVWFTTYHRASYRTWLGRAITGEFPTTQAPGIEVDPETFGPYPRKDDEEFSGAATSLQVISEQPRAAAAALTAAGERLVRVDETGHEYTSMEDCVGPTYTPNYVSDVLEHPLGPYVYLDTKSAMWGPMARTMLHILVTELATAGVTEATIQSKPG